MSFSSFFPNTHAAETFAQLLSHCTTACSIVQPCKTVQLTSSYRYKGAQEWKKTPSLKHEHMKNHTHTRAFAVGCGFDTDASHSLTLQEGCGNLFPSLALPTDVHTDTNNQELMCRCKFQGFVSHEFGGASAQLDSTTCRPPVALNSNVAESSPYHSRCGQDGSGHIRCCAHTQRTKYESAQPPAL